MTRALSVSHSIRCLFGPWCCVAWICITVLASSSTVGAQADDNESTTAILELNSTGAQQKVAKLLNRDDQTTDYKALAAMLWANQNAVDANARMQQKEQDAAESFKGWGFSAGLGFSFYSTKNSHIDKAVLVDSIVRIEERSTKSARLMLESHFLAKTYDSDMYGWGPFVSVLSSGDELIDAFGFGLMGAARLKSGSDQALNIGVGVIWDLKVDKLGNGIKEDQPLQDGETEIRIKKEDAPGLLVMVSFRFQ